MTAVFALLFLAAIFVVLPIALTEPYRRGPESARDWPGGAVPSGERSFRVGRGPFREATAVEARTHRVKPGVPFVVSSLAALELMLSFCWFIGLALSVFELASALAHRTAAWPLVASAGLCAVRACVGLGAAGSVLANAARAARVAIPIAIALDAALYLVALPLSDSRAADRNMALVGLALSCSLALAYGSCAYRRRGLVPDPPRDE